MVMMNRSDGIEVRFPLGYFTGSVGRASLCSYQCHWVYLNFCRKPRKVMAPNLIKILLLVLLLGLGYYPKNTSREECKIEIPFNNNGQHKWLHLNNCLKLSLKV